ncbi:MAG: Na+/H+ antiporter subunit E [Devosia sp.]|uniref:Na+/H+ antiporter subunit E n=1 Tax=Devosia sp. TaxID=1871048 RepID=UPI001AD0A7DA|nr:Na+/H+ antiporter subunit E [Devosia sp.]MBN9309287.1 Na+/H+ antiporter subunit E [Devosia sp.]MBN9314949.1 Na+/H+ antiporter subunit E [Devosia sp.]
MNLVRFPLLWLALLAMWLLLNGSVAPAQLLLGVIVATLACWAVTPVAPPTSRIRHLAIVATLAGLLVRDVVRSNIDVLRLILSGRPARSAFVNIPLELTDENGLAVLACIVTATPGSAWIRHDSKRNVVTIHVLDTADKLAWADDFKRTYERRLVEILQ